MKRFLILFSLFFLFQASVSTTIWSIEDSLPTQPKKTLLQRVWGAIRTFCEGSAALVPAAAVNSSSPRSLVEPEPFMLPPQSVRYLVGILVELKTKHKVFAVAPFMGSGHRGLVEEIEEKHGPIRKVFWGGELYIKNETDETAPGKIVTANPTSSYVQGLIIQDSTWVRELKMSQTFLEDSDSIASDQEPFMFLLEAAPHLVASHYSYEPYDVGREHLPLLFSQYKIYLFTIKAAIEELAVELKYNSSSLQQSGVSRHVSKNIRWGLQLLEQSGIDDLALGKGFHAEALELIAKLEAKNLSQTESKKLSSVLSLLNDYLDRRSRVQIFMFPPSKP